MAEPVGVTVREPGRQHGWIELLDTRTTAWLIGSA